MNLEHTLVPDTKMVLVPVDASDAVDLSPESVAAAIQKHVARGMDEDEKALMLTPEEEDHYEKLIQQDEDGPKFTPQSFAIMEDAEAVLAIIQARTETDQMMSSGYVDDLFALVQILWRNNKKVG